MTGMAAYEAGLSGAECWFRTVDGDRRRLPVARWSGAADDRDQRTVAAVLSGLREGGRVLDAGCGPGRLTAALGSAGAERGTTVVGVDVSTVAVHLARARGVTAVRADVLAPPRSVRDTPWDRILLADGNLGIGGDPARLLRRVAGLLAPGGRIVADVLAAGDVVRGRAWIESVDGLGAQVGGAVPWAWVGVDAIERLGRQAGLGRSWTVRAGRPDRRIVVGTMNALDRVLDGLKERAPKPPDESDFTSRWHHEAVAARVGAVLGVCFTVCFVTGLLSHFIQHPTGWFVWPAHPVWLFRVTQGVHVLTGLVAIPLLLVKLWTVYPKLFVNPPVRSLLHGVERLSVALLFASSLFQLVTGIQNIAHWYPWGFSFPPAHYALAWVAMGSILVHVAVKLPQIRAGLGAPVDGGTPAPVGTPPGDGLSRRWLLLAAGASAGVALLATAGQTVGWLRWVSLLAVRTGLGPQGVPVNKTAVSAGVQRSALDPAWTLTVRGPPGRSR